MFELTGKCFSRPDLYPYPPRCDIRDVLLIALLYLMLLILTKGVVKTEAYGMASRKYGISEEELRNAARGQPWE